MKVKIEGMSCIHCIKRVSNALLDNGATNVKVEIGSAEFENLDATKAVTIIEDLGFDCFTN